MRYFDAHNHLHDERLMPLREACVPELEALPLRVAVVNGTRPDDWEEVRALAGRHPWVVPAYGLHPWYVAQAGPGWAERLRELLEERPDAGVGEIGLDRWVKDHDLPRQLECFRAQLAVAAELERPATIHCLQAWGALEETLRSGPRPARGFLLHSYGGPAEMVPGLVKLGAYFSFSPYFLHERKTAARTVFRTIPRERLLVETDAPDMAPPEARNPRALMAEGKPLNHPANIVIAYEGLAETLGVPVEEVAAIVEENFRRLFGAAGG